jgi:hypothetical protein
MHVSALCSQKPLTQFRRKSGAGDILQLKEATMRPGRIFVCTALVLSSLTPSLAQAADERFQLERTDNGYVRLDTKTGRTSLCQERGDQLVCRMATEDQDAYDRSIGALENRIDTLEARITALETRQPGTNLPNEEEFEQTLGYMERFFRRFMGIVGEMDRNFGGEKSDTPPPDRT